MNKVQIAEAVLAGKRLAVVELRTVEAGKFEAKNDNGKITPESHFLRYRVITGNDSADCIQYAARGAAACPVSLKFKSGQRAVVVGDFEHSKYGLQCRRLESIELLAD